MPLERWRAFTGMHARIPPCGHATDLEVRITHPYVRCQCPVGGVPALFRCRKRARAFCAHGSLGMTNRMH